MTNQTMWGPQDDTDYLGNPAKRAMFDMRNHWDSHDPHPLDTLTQTTAKLVPDVFQLGPSYKSDKSLDFGFTATDTLNPSTGFSSNTSPSEKVNQQGMLSNLSTPSMAQTTVDALDSAGAASHGAGIPSYGWAKNLFKSTPGNNETISAARQQAEAETWPGTGQKASEQAGRAIATSNMRRGFEYEHPMGSVVQASRGDLIPSNLEGESRATYDVLANTGSMIGKYGPEATVSAHGADTSPQKLFAEEMQWYQDYLPEGLKSTGQALHDSRAIGVQNFVRDRENALKGIENRERGIKNMTAKAALVINEILSDAHDKKGNRPIVADLVRHTRQEQQRGRDEMIQSRGIYDEDPEKMAQNAYDYWGQEALSQHVADIMLVYATRGFSPAVGYAVNVFDATIDEIADSIAETGDYDLLYSLGEELKKGKPDGDQVVVDVISTSLGKKSGTAVKTLWRLLTDKERGLLMNQVREKQAGKNQ
ncbi:hypothetical protein NB640_09290 [Oxalobacter vibrioformis]|uniref:Uncharacterized protein n=1 Tax=Oxalobacter vibrioformis TaxID=933080 RepID=A0A9E9P3S7_9BURK|nr:hypothetical protein [Oxalobacter vibrioformis]WAW09436.1 hypothetical protein NB640_09290 [Oxalobacter vibrioformis]